MEAGPGKFIGGVPDYEPIIVCFKTKSSQQNQYPIQTFYIGHDAKLDKRRVFCDF